MKPFKIAFDDRWIPSDYELIHTTIRRDWQRTEGYFISPLRKVQGKVMFGRKNSFTPKHIRIFVNAVNVSL